MTSSRRKLTLFHAGRRTSHDIDAGGVLAGFTGVLVRDGYVGYDHIDTATHAECGAHLLRALKGVHDGDPAGQMWAEYMANTLLIAKQMMQQAATAGRTRLSEDQAGFIRSAYAGAISAGRQANAGRPEAKAAKLVERFARDAHDILRFTTDTAIWFSNNQSERDLRPTKQAVLTECAPNGQLGGSRVQQVPGEVELGTGVGHQPDNVLGAVALRELPAYGEEERRGDDLAVAVQSARCVEQVREPLVPLEVAFNHGAQHGELVVGRHPAPVPLRRLDATASIDVRTARHPGKGATVATTEELALLRAIVDCDTQRLDEMAKTLYETEHLDGCADVLAAAFRVAVRMQFPDGHCPADVIRLVADTRIMAGPDGDRVQPIPMEFTVRSVLEDPRMGELFGGGVTRYTQLMVCRFLASRERLGDADTFIRQVLSMLDEPTGGQPE